MKKLRLRLSLKDQKELGYSNRYIEHDLDYLMRLAGGEFDLEKMTKEDEHDLMEVLRKDLLIPKTHLLYPEEYRVRWYRGILHVKSLDQS